DDPELRVPVGIVGALARLAVGLQAELLLLKQFANHRVADLVPKLAQFVRKAAQALAGPAQRRHRIAARVGLDQCVQVVEKTGIRFTQRFAAPARPTYAIDRRRGRRFQFLQPPSDRAGGDPRHPRHRGYAAISRRTGFSRDEKPALTFIQLRRYRQVARLELAKRLFINHPTTLRRHVHNGNPATPLPPNPIRLLPDRPWMPPAASVLRIGDSKRQTAFAKYGQPIALKKPFIPRLFDIPPATCNSTV